MISIDFFGILFPFILLQYIVFLSSWRDVEYQKGDKFSMLRSLLLDYFLNEVCYGHMSFTIITISFDSVECFMYNLLRWHNLEQVNKSQCLN